MFSMAWMRPGSCCDNSIDLPTESALSYALPYTSASSLYPGSNRLMLFLTNASITRSPGAAPTSLRKNPSNILSGCVESITCLASSENSAGLAVAENLLENFCLPVSSESSGELISSAVRGLSSTTPSLQVKLGISPIFCGANTVSSILAV